jgi:hypothetical protein
MGKMRGTFREQEWKRRRFCLWIFGGLDFDGKKMRERSVSTAIKNLMLQMPSITPFVNDGAPPPTDNTQEPPDLYR